MKKETGFFYNPVSIFRGKVALWEFDSLHCVKKGVWHLRKNLVVFCPPECQKTQEFPGFFGGASFLHYPSGAGSRSRTGTPSLAVDFESTTSTNSIIPAHYIFDENPRKQSLEIGGPFRRSIGNFENMGCEKT